MFNKHLGSLRRYNNTYSAILYDIRVVMSSRIILGARQDDSREDRKVSI